MTRNVTKKNINVTRNFYQIVAIYLRTHKAIGHSEIFKGREVSAFDNSSPTTT